MLSDMSALTSREKTGRETAEEVFGTVCIEIDGQRMFNVQKL
jgi:hypothetical protein